MEFKINEQLNIIIPELHEGDYKALKKSIKEKGQIEPIKVMAEGTIIDGHHRYKACKELGITPTTSLMANIKTIEEALEYSFEINFRRRQLNPFRQSEWAIKVLDAKRRLHKVSHVSQETGEQSVEELANKALTKISNA